ncbi:MAG: protein translocase subunit SecD, partial [Acidobacteriota bacterium]|nr:protein translocase subunit SecD [Acidobacteriota bacterium]
MKKGLRWKLLAVVAVIGLCVFLFTPISKKIKLGLDLKGGIHLLLQVQTNDALTAETDQEITRFSELFKKNNITFQSGVKESPGRFAFTGTDANQESKIKDLVAQYTRDWTISFLADRANFTLTPAAAQVLRDQAV